MKNKQIQAWIEGVNSSHSIINKKNNDKHYNTRKHTKHFYSSAADYNSKGNFKLKIGTAPALCLAVFSLTNDHCSKNKYISRLCFLTGREGLQIVWTLRNMR